MAWFCNEIFFSLYLFLPAHSLLGSLPTTVLHPSISPPSSTARWPWHLTVPLSNMPHYRDFTSSELSATTDRILYNLDDCTVGTEGSVKRRQMHFQYLTNCLSEKPALEMKGGIVTRIFFFFVCFLWGRETPHGEGWCLRLHSYAKTDGKTIWPNLVEK